MIGARIKIDQPLDAGQPKGTICTRLAEITMFVPVSSSGGKDVAINGFDVDAVWKMIRTHLNTAL